MGWICPCGKPGKTGKDCCLYEGSLQQANDKIARLRAALTEIAENAGSLPEAQSIAIDALKR
jgi:hypothetical protein